MQILFIAHRVPFPPDKGDKIRSFHEIKHLSRKHDIHLLAFCDEPDESIYQKDLLEYCRSVMLVELNPLRQKVHALASMFTGDPWTKGYYDSTAMRSAVESTFARKGIDVAIAYSSSVAPYVASLPVRRILDFVDSDAAKWKQYSTIKIGPTRWLYSYEARHLASFERRMMGAFDASIFVNPREIEWLSSGRRSHSGPVVEHLSSKLHFIANGIDMEYFQPQKIVKGGPVMVFTGAMDYFPNVDAVTHFAHSIFPKIRADVPDARFLIVGRRPTAQVRRLGTHSGITVTGSVPDVRPYLQSARAAVVPLRIAQGVQNKVLEALAMGLPVVATPLVANGLAAADELQLFVEHDSTTFAQRVVDCLRGPGRSAAQIARTREILNKYYSWDTNLGALDSLVEPATFRK